MRRAVPASLPDAGMLADMPAWDERPFLWNRLNLASIAEIEGDTFVVACDCKAPKIAMVLGVAEEIPEGRHPVPIRPVEFLEPVGLDPRLAAGLLARGETVLVDGRPIRDVAELPTPKVRKGWVGQCDKCGRIFWWS